MKNITVSVDDATHQAARLHAAAQGTSVSALVKAYLAQLGGSGSIASLLDGQSTNEPSQGATSMGVREMQSAYVIPDVTGSTPPAWTPGGKPRQPGALRVMAGGAADAGDDTWPADVLAQFEDWDEDGFDAVP